MASKGRVVSQGTWYWNADKSAVTSKADSPAAAFLMVRAGSEVDVEELEKVGLPLDGSNPEVDKETGAPVGKKSAKGKVADDGEGDEGEGSGVEGKAPGKAAKTKDK